MSVNLFRNGIASCGLQRRFFRLSKVQGWVISSLVVILLSCSCAWAQEQETDPTVLANQKQARQVLDATIQALGGAAWVNVQSIKIHGRTSGFYQGHPSGSISDFFDYFQPPDKERVEFGKKRNVVQIYTGRTAWEITYKGKHSLPKDQYDDYMRRRDHSLRVVLLAWYKEPETVLIYGKQTLVERHLADQVTLINKENESVELELDAQTHLPLRISWEWRDPQFHDKNHDAENYDDYHAIDGIATPFTVTRYHNDDMVNERFVYSVAYNVPIRPDFFDADIVAQHLQ